MKRAKTLQLIEKKARQNLTIIRSHFKHMYIPFILKLFNYIHNNGELWCFKILWIHY